MSCPAKVLGVSTSSPIVSVGVGVEGQWAHVASEEAPRAASGAVAKLTQDLLDQLGWRLADIDGFVVDAGPGSFTGTRVGVTFGLLWARWNGGVVAGVSSFDLIHPEGVVTVPNTRRDAWLRMPGEAPRLVESLPGDTWGYGSVFPPEVVQWPMVGRIELASLAWVAPDSFRLDYLVAPSISVPKRPYGSAGAVTSGREGASG